MLALRERSFADGDRRDNAGAVQRHADRFADAGLEDFGGKPQLAEQASADRNSSAHLERREENILFVCDEGT